MIPGIVVLQFRVLSGGGGGGGHCESVRKQQQ